MSRALVTGCAGFIGSHLAERLLADGWEVLGVDGFTTSYERAHKERNLVVARDHPDFDFVERDLAAGRADDLLDGVDVVWHLAARAGVRRSFGREFTDYVRDNLHATRNLLEAAGRVRRFVYASSSSVYGDALTLPTPEDAPLVPCSPYGMSKLATERLAAHFHDRHEIPVVGLRYFTVYGPRQRPDMAFTRFILAAMHQRPVDVHGDGRQRRDFTFVDDVVQATVRAGSTGTPGGVYNVGGGRPVALVEAIARIAELLGVAIHVRHHDAAPGDARDTAADGSRCAAELGTAPATQLREGLAAQVEWALEALRLPAAA